MMTDEFDQASDIEQLQRDSAVAAVLYPKLDPNVTFDGTHCIDCQIEIPAARLALLQPYCVRCIDCQVAREFGLKRSKI